jgi:hypothetical protein
MLQSGEDIPTGYQKISYHMVFDVKYDLRQKARLVAGGNWAVNDKEDIYLGVVRMDAVRIGFFLGELYELSYCAFEIGNDFSQIITSDCYLCTEQKSSRNIF